MVKFRYKHRIVIPAFMSGEGYIEKYHPRERCASVQ